MNIKTNNLDVNIGRLKAPINNALKVPLNPLVRLNCDMGESSALLNSGLDNEIMPYIDMANLACGFHAGSPSEMKRSVKLATSYNKEIGAHPSYPDIMGFGRRSMECSSEEIKSLMVYQMGALDGICKIFNTSIGYAKPHGALYNDMMKNIDIFKSVVEAISLYNKSLKLMILSNSQNDKYREIASEFGIELLYELFADRNYNDDGSLVSRKESDALIVNEEVVLERIKLIKNRGIILTKNGKELSLKIDTICVHSDTPNALKSIKSIKNILR